jgi:DNA-binding PadR family transcriptional regulator
MVSYINLDDTTCMEEFGVPSHVEFYKILNKLEKMNLISKLVF